MKVVSFGAAIYSLRVPDETGKVGEIILGFDYIQGKHLSKYKYMHFLRTKIRGLVGSTKM